MRLNGLDLVKGGELGHPHRVCREARDRVVVVDTVAARLTFLRADAYNVRLAALHGEWGRGRPDPPLAREEVDFVVMLADSKLAGH